MGRGGETQKLERDVTGGAIARTNTRASEPEKANKSTEQEREWGFIYHRPTEPETVSTRSSKRSDMLSV
jgi:hypothetical protein